jgi:hypothetical protein
VRQILYSTALISALALAGDGRTPRSSSSDYPVHEDTKTATIAAVRVPPEQLNKNFPSDFSKKYVVVEVAIYPKAGAIDLVSADFVLRLPDSETHPDTAEEVAGMWRPRGSGPTAPELGSKVHVTGETGVIMQQGTDPNTGRKTSGVGTYEGVGVNNYPNQTPPSSSGHSNADADRMEAQLDKWSLPQGKTSVPVAGYLYFPVKKNKGALELQYTHEDSSANLKLPAPTK